jgi:uncharacterized protein with PQ loop repeat
MDHKTLLLILLIIISNVSSYIQAYEIYKTKSSQSISLTSWLFSLFANIGWIIFSLYDSNMPVFYSSSIALVGNALVIYLKSIDG